jgi:hypothetical protein
VATAITLITRAMRLAGVIGKGETPDDDEAVDGLTALNAMLDSWQIERLFVYQIRTEQFTWDANDQTQTVGSGGDFNTDLPTRVADDCSFTISGTDYPSKLIDIDAWTAIPDKSTTNSWAWWIYPEYGASLVTLYGYPIPNENVTFNLRTWKRLQQFTSLTDTLTLPPGNERAIAFSLAEEFGGPEFGVTVPPGVIAIARSARRALRRVNAPSPVMKNPTGYLSLRYGYGNISSGS